MHSIKLREFVEEIKYKNRNPQNNKVLSILEDVDKNPKTTLKEGTIFYRCRLVKDNLDRIDIENGFAGYDSAGSFVTPVFATYDMRANYRFIPYLYVASTEELSVKETRPEIVSLVSIARIIADEELMLFDLRNTKTLEEKRNVRDNLLIDLAELYSKPVESNEEQVDYVPTQYIAEFIKNLGYDGIIYPSAHGMDRETDYNIVIFNYDKCHALDSKLVVRKKTKLD